MAASNPEFTSIYTAEVRATTLSLCRTYKIKPIYIYPLAKIGTSCLLKGPKLIILNIVIISKHRLNFCPHNTCMVFSSMFNHSLMGHGYLMNLYFPNSSSSTFECYGHSTVFCGFGSDLGCE